MAFTVGDFQDLIRLLDEHPEWRAELRRHVLSDDLIELPALVRQLAEAQTRTEQRVEDLTEAQARTERRLEELAQAQARTEQRVEELVEAQRRTEQRVEELTEAQARTERRVEELAQAQARTERRVEELTDAQRRTEQRVEELTEAQARTERRVQELAQGLAALTGEVRQLKADVAVLKIDVAELKGDSLERRYREHAPAYFSRVVRKPRLISQAALADLLDDAVDRQALTEHEQDEVLRADAVLSGQRRDDRHPVYVLVEVSAVVDRHDVERAVRRAAMLSKVGQPAIAAVAGHRLTDSAASLAQQYHVWHVLDGRDTASAAAPAGN